MNDQQYLQILESELGNIYLPRVGHEDLIHNHFPCVTEDEQRRIIGLNLSNLSLESIPNIVFELDNLQVLRLHRNKLRELNSGFERLGELRALYLSTNRISVFPALIESLPKLEVLGLNQNYLTDLPPSFCKADSLKKLGLSGNPLKYVPTSIAQVINLEGLYLNRTDIFKVPNWLYDMPSLKELTFAGTPLEIIDVSIENARSLEYLNLSATDIKNLPGSIWNLINLKELDLSHSILIELSSEIQRLVNLESLNLSSSRLEKIPSALNTLTNIRKLELANTNLLSSEISIVLEGLNKLKDLSLSGIQLKNVPSSLLDRKSLVQIDLSNTGITCIPKEIFELPDLELLNLIGNRIRWLPPNILDSNLKCYWKRKEKDKGIYLFDNPLASPPPEIIEKGSEALESYFRSSTSGTLPLNEVKVLLVGDGGAGKTSLAKCLLGEQFDQNESQTHGINIENWDFTIRGFRMRARMWDFGGQEIMHATHQFFLSQRSMYVLVLDSRKDEKIEYWLQHIQTFGGDSPVSIVINKTDENPGFDINRRFLKQKYRNIIGFFRLSCKTGEGITQFSRKLQSKLSRLKHARTEWAVSWFEVKEKLEGLDKDYISLSNFRDICRSEGLERNEDQETLVGLLHDLGIVIRFKDLPLRDTNVINPKWITKGVYSIINSKVLAKGDGVLAIEDMSKALDNSTHPSETHNFIIELMKKFELCYLFSLNEVLIPSLLPVEEPAFERESSDFVSFIIAYEFLPKSVIARFIVRMHNDIVNSLRWRTGVVLQSGVGEARAFVRADEDRRRIEIQIWGSQRRDYLAVLVHAFRTINTTFRRLKSEERIPLPDNRDVSVSLNHLLLLESRGIQNFIPEGSKKDYDVGDLLGQVRDVRNLEMEILSFLEEIKESQDTEETLRAKANEILQLQPNFFGIGININALINQLMSSSKKN